MFCPWRVSDLLQCPRDVGGRAVVINGVVTDVGEEGDIDAGAVVFLVVLHEAEEFVGVGGGREGGVVPVYGTGEVFVSGSREAGKLHGEVEFGDEAEGDGFAVEEGSAFAEGEAFDGMADGMPEVEGSPFALFRGIPVHDVGFHADGFPDEGE